MKDNKTGKMPKKAMCLAAGLGTRMMPLTQHTAKPLLKVMEKPIIDHALDALVKAGVDDVVVNYHHLANQVQSHLEKRAKPNLKLIYEPELLETGGGLKNALPYFNNEAFFALNTDVIWIENNSSYPFLNHLADAWDDDKMDLLLLLQPKDEGYFFSGDGDYHMNADGMLRLTNRETNEPAPYYFNGPRIVHPRLFEGAPDGKWSFLKLMKKAESNGRLYGVVHNGKSYHIGKPDAFEKANKILSQKGQGQCAQTSIR
jgi:MurNAc alpha-1-phosphate uridylyltransferase